jgi:hypothetical protein
MTFFVNYVTYNKFGGIDKSIPREVLENWLLMHEQTGKPVLDIWELRRSEIYDGAIEVRLSPAYELDGKDDNWRSWHYTFYPYRP